MPDSSATSRSNTGGPPPRTGARPFSYVQHLPISLSYTQEDDNNPHSPGPTTLSTYPIGPWQSFVHLKEGEYPLGIYICFVQERYWLVFPLFRLSSLSCSLSSSGSVSYSFMDLKPPGPYRRNLLSLLPTHRARSTLTIHPSPPTSPGTSPRPTASCSSACGASPRLSDPSHRCPQGGPRSRGRGR